MLDMNAPNMIILLGIGCVFKMNFYSETILTGDNQVWKLWHFRTDSVSLMEMVLNVDTYGFGYCKMVWEIRTHIIVWKPLNIDCLCDKRRWCVFESIEWLLSHCVQCWNLNNNPLHASRDSFDSVYVLFWHAFWKQSIFEFICKVSIIWISRTVECLSSQIETKKICARKKFFFELAFEEK